MANNNKAPALDVLIRAKDAYEMVQKMKLKPTDKKMMEKKAILALKQAYQNYLKADDEWVNVSWTPGSIYAKPLKDYQEAYNNAKQYWVEDGFPVYNDKWVMFVGEVRDQFNRQPVKWITVDTVLPVWVSKSLKTNRWRDYNMLQNIYEWIDKNMSKVAWDIYRTNWRDGLTDREYMQVTYNNPEYDRMRAADKIAWDAYWRAQVNWQKAKNAWYYK